MGEDRLLMKSGAYVIMFKAGRRKIFRLRNKNHKLGRDKINLMGAIGHPYRSFFKLKLDVKGGTKVLILEKCSRSSVRSAIPEKAEDCAGEDNRNIVDNNCSQRLSREEILALRDQGMGGDTLVETIVEHSSSFGEKTEFSQEKYLKKKDQKYGEFISLHPPTARLIATCMYEDNPLQILNLREDSLAQILTVAGVRYGGKYLLIEDGTEGLVLAGMLERMGEGGQVLQLHQVECPRTAVSMLNLPAGHLEKMVMAVRLNSLLKLNGEINDDSSKDLPSTGYQKLELLALDSLRSKDFDALIIASRSHPKHILTMLLEFLKPSAPFVVFSPYLEVVKDCFVSAKTSSSIVHEKVTETWFREYQVLPARTHPQINMSGGGGYLLSGIKVLKSQSAAAEPAAVFEEANPARHIRFADSEEETEETTKKEEPGSTLSANENISVENEADCEPPAKRACL